MSAEVGGTVESGGFTVSSTHESAEDMAVTLAEPTETPDPDPSKAASVLGKRGGEAAAAKRAADAKETKRAARDGEEPAKGAAEMADEDATLPTEERSGRESRHSAVARMREATRVAAEERQAAREAREELARLRTELERTRQPAVETKPVKSEPEGKPKEEDFATWSEYLDAREDWREAQREAKEQVRQREQLQKEQIRTHEDRFLTVMSKTHKADPEFTSKLSPEVGQLWPTFKLVEFAQAGKISWNDPRFNDPGTWIANEIVDNAEQAPALLLHLSEHKDDFQRIAALSTPRYVTREIGKILARLDVATTATDSKPTVSKAPPPVRPVTGTPLSADPNDVSDEDSLEDHIRKMNARERAERRGHSRL